MLRTPAFKRAPLLLAKRPAVLVSVLGTAAILALVAALTPLFISSSASAALRRELEGRCPLSFAGTTTLFGVPSPFFTEQPSLASTIEDNREILEAAIPDHPNLGEPEVTLRGTVVSVEREGPPLTGRFVARDGFRDHIELLDGDHGPGAYIDDVLASDLGAGPGDTLTFSAGGTSGRLTIQAVYRGLYDQLTDPYWCGVQDVLEPNIMGDRPPPPILVDPVTFQEDPDLMTAVYAGYGTTAGTWAIPVDLDGLTVTDAIEVAAVFEELDAAVQQEVEGPAFFGGTPGIHSDLLLVSQRVQALTDALSTSILPLAAVVLVAATALIGGAGSYWVDRKRAELQYLSALGAGPGAIGTKAALEFFPAVLAGSAVGWGLANLLVTLVGPSPAVEGGARLTAAWVTLVAMALGTLTVALVAGSRSRGLLDNAPKRRRHLPWRIPAMVVAVLGAILIRSRIGDSAVTIGENQLVGSVDPLVLFFPLFTFTAVVLLVAEVVIRVLPLLRRARLGGHALYLATRRVGSAPTLVVALIAGAALPVATLIYAASLTRSATSTIDAKGRSFIGADISTPVFGLIDPPPELAGESTVVIKMERADLGGETVDVLAVDEDTFANGAFWDPSFSSTPLDRILATLAGDGVGGPLPAYVANGAADDGLLRTASGSVEVTIEGSVGSFPGGRGSRPLLIVDQRRLNEVMADAGGHIRSTRYLMWTSGHTAEEVERAMGAADIGYAYTVEAATTLDQLKFAAIIWTFDFLEIYAALAGLIAVGGVLLYVDTRQRHRNLSYALAKRMGLQRGEHLRAGFIELAGLTLLGTLAGLLAARVAARSLYTILDAVPETPPGPRWIGAIDLSAIVIVISVVVAGAAAILAQRTADGADTSELLRHGD